MNMEAKLGDIRALRELRDSLIRDSLSEERARERLDHERWESFKKTAQGIIESVDTVMPGSVQCAPQFGYPTWHAAC